MKIITTNDFVYLVEFQNTTEVFIVQGEGLYDLLKSKPNKHVGSIKMSGTRIPSFKRVARSLILAQFSWNTEIHEFLTSIPYFN